jgi:hypothetical protein
METFKSLVSPRQRVHRSQFLRLSCKRLRISGRSLSRMLDCADFIKLSMPYNAAESTTVAPKRAFTSAVVSCRLLMTALHGVADSRGQPEGAHRSRWT